jgi:hypothetical protein
MHRNAPPPRDLEALLAERLELIRRQSASRSELIRLRQERVDALRTQLWKRIDRVEQESRSTDERLADSTPGDIGALPTYAS